MAQPDHAGPIGNIFRHSGWERDRSRIREALFRTNQSVSRIMAFDACGHDAYVMVAADDPTKVTVMGSGCHDRFCLPCAQERARIIGENVCEYLGDTPTRFITLTLKHSDQQLQTQLDRLLECFTALRRRQFWLDSVTGGLATIEVHYNHRGEWHPHLHILAHGAYLDYKKLRKAWNQITGDSFIVDIRMARSNDEVVRYVSKYVAKGFSPKITLQPELLDEMIWAMYGRKLIFTFGTWRDLKTTATVTSDKWIFLCTLTTLVERAKRQRGIWLQLLTELSPNHADALIDCVPDASDERGPPQPPKQLELPQLSLIDVRGFRTF